MNEVCYQVITWLQSLTVASVMLNFLLVGLVGIAWWDVRSMRGGKDVPKPKQNVGLRALLPTPAYDAEKPAPRPSSASWYPDQ